MHVERLADTERPYLGEVLLFFLQIPLGLCKCFFGHSELFLFRLNYLC